MQFVYMFKQGIYAIGLNTLFQGISAQSSNAARGTAKGTGSAPTASSFGYGTDSWKHVH